MPDDLIKDAEGDTILEQVGIRVNYFLNLRKKSNLHYTRVITPKSVTSDETHLCDLTPRQYNSEDTPQR